MRKPQKAVDWHLWAPRTRSTPVWQFETALCLDFIFANPYPRPSSGWSNPVPAHDGVGSGFWTRQNSRIRRWTLLS